MEYDIGDRYYIPPLYQISYHPNIPITTEHIIVEDRYCIELLYTKWGRNVSTISIKSVFNSVSFI